MPNQPHCVSRRVLLSGGTALMATGLPRVTHADPADPLPSWREGPVKQALLGFVGRVTQAGGPDFVPPARRIAVFDNDGTLWAEQPTYFQLAFALDRIRALAPSHPEWRGTQPYEAVITDDREALSAMSERDLLSIVAATHSGMTTDAFAATVAEWLRTARHPRFGQPYDRLVYQPQLELLAHLRASGFKTFIVSAGGVEFMRVFAERAYGIPPEQVIGSTGVADYRLAPDGRPVLIKQPKVEFIDDGPGKPVSINRSIGRRPILAFGNSDGDAQMLEWTSTGSGARLSALLHHTDADREWTYDRASQVGRLDKALEQGVTQGWLIIDMKRDWRHVFPL